MQILKRIGVISVSVILTVAAILYIWGWILPAAKVKRLEKLSIEDSVSASYASLLDDEDTIYGYAEDLYNMGARLPGTAAGAEAQAYVKDKFTEFGLSDVDIIPSETKLYTCSDYSLSLDGKSLDCCYINYSACDLSYGSFDSGKTEAEMVYVGTDTASKTDVKGKIVVADITFQSIPYVMGNFVGDLVYDPNHTLGLFDTKDVVYMGSSFTDSYFYYMEQGAVGYIGILDDYYDSPEYYSEDYTYYGAMKIPGVFVSNTVGNEIKAAISDDSSVKAAIHVAGNLEKVEAGAVIGYVKGNSDDTIMVQCHYDSITNGAVEDASGMCCILALAKMYAQIPQEDLKKSILFIACDTHFSDYDTHDAVVEALFGADSNIVANLCIEHICKEYEINDDGTISATGEVDPRIVFVSGSDTLIEIVNEEFVRHGMDRTLVLPATLLGDELCTDADEFYQEGIPVCNLISSPIYLYSSDDTLDKIAKDALVPTCQTFSDILWRYMSIESSELYAD